MDPNLEAAGTIDIWVPDTSVVWSAGFSPNGGRRM